MAIEYAKKKKDQIEEAIKKLERSDAKSVKIDSQSTVDLSVTRADSQLGRKIESEGKKGGYKQQPSYFLDAVEYIIYSTISR